MVVQLVAHTPEPEKIVAAAAKLCYSPVGVNELMDHLKDADIERFLEKLIALGHESPLEHITFTFAVEGVSRVLTHQLVRHRIASYSQQSQRYVKLEAFEYIIPPAILENETAKALFVESMQYNQRCYDQLVSILMDTYTKRYMSDGVPEKRAQNMAEKSSIEDARFVFPNACETKIIVTMNARSLLNFFNHRLCNRAQWEIRELATKMLIEVKRVAPHIFKQAGPPCLSEKCPEGVMTCGKITEVRTFFRQLD